MSLAIDVVDAMINETIEETIRVQGTMAERLGTMMGLSLRLNILRQVRGNLVKAECLMHEEEKALKRFGKLVKDNGTPD